MESTVVNCCPPFKVEASKYNIHGPHSKDVTQEAYDTCQNKNICFTATGTFFSSNAMFIPKGKDVKLKGQFPVGILHVTFHYTDQDSLQHDDVLKLGSTDLGRHSD